MFIQIVPGVRVFVSDKQVEFIHKHTKESFKDTELPANEVEMAKVLADKSIFVRKKIDTGVQYALNRRIRFVNNATKK